MRYKIEYEKVYIDGPKRGIKKSESIGFQRRHDVDAWLSAVQGAPIRDLITNEYYFLEKFKVISPKDLCVDVEASEESLEDA